MVVAKVKIDIDMNVSLTQKPLEEANIQSAKNVDKTKGICEAPNDISIELLNSTSPYSFPIQ